jgi:hypothetical protein
MGLITLKKYISITNITDKLQRLRDRQLANGFLDVGAGESVSIAAPVYQRNFRASWLRKTENIPAEVEAPAEVEVVVKMSDLRAKAKELGVSLPVGTSKEEAIEIIKQTEESIETN